jgi:hypothetical protein
VLPDANKARAQLFRLAVIVRNIAFYRSLSGYRRSLGQNFWIYTYNNFFDMAVLEWCKTFGSRSETTHWSAVVPDAEAFRTALLARLGITPDQWTAYWEDLKGYRDSSVAHHEVDPERTKYPLLDTALDSTCYLYDFLVEELRIASDPVYFLPRYLKVYYQQILAQAEKLAKVAYEASRNVEERVK